MQPITTKELETRSAAELSALFREVTHILTRSQPETPERRGALASLETIGRAWSARL